MKKSLLLTAAFLALPGFAFAQEGTIEANTLGGLLRSIIVFINEYLIPFLWALAFLMFLFGVYQFFIAGGADEEKRSQGKQFAVWGIIAFFVMSSLWGIINLFNDSFQFGNENTPSIPTFNTSGQRSPSPAPSTNGGPTGDPGSLFY